MLAEKYFPKRSSQYQSLGKLFQKLDGFGALKPERWFAVWTMVLSGANVTAHINDRYTYWEWSSFSILLLVIMTLSIWWVTKFPVLAEGVTNLKTGLFALIIGFILFSIGTIPSGFDHMVFIYGLPYYIFFLVGFMTWSIPIDENNNSVPKKEKMAPMLLMISLLTLIAAVLGFIQDDPMISTIAAVYSPFPVVALTFKVAIRHIQRARMHVVFIPCMFIAVRFPWFLLMVVPLFIILRHYYYFVHGKVKPCFKVDLPHQETY